MKIKLPKKLKLGLLLASTPFIALVGAWQVSRIWISENIEEYKDNRL